MVGTSLIAGNGEVGREVFFNSRRPFLREFDFCNCGEDLFDEYPSAVDASGRESTSLNDGDVVECTEPIRFRLLGMLVVVER